MDEAEKHLQQGEEQAKEIQHQYHIAESKRIRSQLHFLRGDFGKARIALVESIDLFERLGMRRELAETREELRRIKAGEMPVV